MFFFPDEVIEMQNKLKGHLGCDVERICLYVFSEFRFFLGTNKGVSAVALSDKVTIIDETLLFRPTLVRRFKESFFIFP